MTLTRDRSFNPSDKTLTDKWPRQICKPSELIDAVKRQTTLRLLKSPLCSKLILQIVGSWAYMVAHMFNKTRVVNIETFNNELRLVEKFTEQIRLKDEATREKAFIQRAPLLTLSNHISCIDDPVLWSALLPLSYYSTNTDSVRWSAAAVEICFSKAWHSAFFSLGKTFPIIRGAGIKQPAMDFALALMQYNQWLHLFPEGKVMRDDKQQKISNRDRGYTFKWGTAHLILNYLRNSSASREKVIRILPFYHLGLDEILPIGWPYIPRVGKQITILMNPSVIVMNQKLLDDILNSRKLDGILCKSKSDDEVKRIKLTNYLEEEVEKLIEPATEMHQSRGD